MIEAVYRSGDRGRCYREAFNGNSHILVINLELGCHHPVRERGNKSSRGHRSLKCQLGIKVWNAASPPHRGALCCSPGSEACPAIRHSTWVACLQVPGLAADGLQPWGSLSVLPSSPLLESTPWRSERVSEEHGGRGQSRGTFLEFDIHWYQSTFSLHRLHSVIHSF